MGRYVDGLCRRVERGGRKERSGQCLCQVFGVGVESALFPKPAPFIAFLKTGFREPLKSVESAGAGVAKACRQRPTPMPGQPAAAP